MERSSIGIADAALDGGGGLPSGPAGRGDVAGAARGSLLPRSPAPPPLPLRGSPLTRGEVSLDPALKLAEEKGEDDDPSSICSLRESYSCLVMNPSSNSTRSFFSRSTSVDMAPGSFASAGPFSCFSFSTRGGVCGLAHPPSLRPRTAQEAAQSGAG